MQSPILGKPARRVVIFGFGAVAKTCMPYIIEKIPITEFLIVDMRKIDDSEISEWKYIKKITTMQIEFTYENMYEEVKKIIKDNDILIDLAGGSESLFAMRACGEKENVIYMNASMEEFDSHRRPSLYKIYPDTYKFIEEHKFKTTGCLEVGANPGMITHFAIMALKHMAQGAIDRQVKDAEEIKELLENKEWGKLAYVLKVDAVHTAEQEEIEPNDRKKFEGYTASSWCPYNFHDEFTIPAEISMGSEDKEDMLKMGCTLIPESDPPIVRAPYPTFLYSVLPRIGKYTGKAVRHPETVEIVKLFSYNGHMPSMTYVYHPSNLMRSDMTKKDWEKLPKITYTEKNNGPLKGITLMGATLLSSRPDIPHRFYGSQITAEQSRQADCKVNPITLQVAAGIISHLILAIKNPNKGFCFPHEFDTEEIMKLAAPYLGTIVDCDMEEKIPTKYKDLVSTEENMNCDF